ncbi:hypothetical protein FGB62_274g015 [Gracilaria domingensis]|nr:hypothetical protein FGB62_274g015 [Gracilaria domingensis]
MNTVAKDRVKNMSSDSLLEHTLRGFILVLGRTLTERNDATLCKLTKQKISHFSGKLSELISAEGDSLQSRIDRAHQDFKQLPLQRGTREGSMGSSSDGEEKTGLSELSVKVYTILKHTLIDSIRFMIVKTTRAGDISIPPQSFSFGSGDGISRILLKFATPFHVFNLSGADTRTGREHWCRTKVYIHATPEKKIQNLERMAYANGTLYQLGQSFSEVLGRTKTTILKSEEEGEILRILESDTNGIYEVILRYGNIRT